MTIAAWSVELSLEELRVIRSVVPSLMLPAGFGVESDARDFDPGDAAFADCSSAAMEALRESGLLIDENHSRHEERLAAPLVAALSFHAIADQTFHSRAWSSTEDIREVVSLSGEVCSVLRRTRDRSGPNDPTAVRVLVSLFLRTSLVEHLMTHVADVETGVERAGRTKVGLIESRALIAALRQGDARLVGAIAEQFQASDSVGLLSELDGPIESGFHIDVFDRRGHRVFAADWYRGRDCWLKVDLNVGDGAISAPSIAETGRVAIQPVGRDAIRADLLELIAEMVMSANVSR